MTSQPEVFFITGEVSGDRHAAPVVEELRARGFRVSGAGGQRMRAAGAELVADSTIWGAMGVPEAIRKLPALYLRTRALLREIQRRTPAVVALVDFGFFNVRMAKYLSRLGNVKILYYFPPGSWRQEPRDWSRLAAITDCIATPFARNAEHLNASGANAHWVGHPAIDFLQPVADRPALRAQLGLPDGRPVIGILAGSRPAERRILGPVLLDAAQIIKHALPEAAFLWSSSSQATRMERRLAARAQALNCITPVQESHSILRASDLALVAMGTATLEAAAALTPVVTTYDASLLSKWIAVRVLKQQQRFYSMPNLLLGREVVPEIVPTNARERITAENVATAALAIIRDQDCLRRMRCDLDEVRGMLGSPGVAKRTADLIAAMARRDQ